MSSTIIIIINKPQLECQIEEVWADLCVRNTFSNWLSSISINLTLTFNLTVKYLYCKLSLQQAGNNKQANSSLLGEWLSTYFDAKLPSY